MGIFRQPPGQYTRRQKSRHNSRDKRNAILLQRLRFPLAVIRRSGRRFSQPQHNGRHTLRRSIVLRKQQADCTRFRFYEYFWQQQPFRPIERFFRRRRLPHFAPRMAQFQLFIHGRRYAISARILRLRTLRTSLWCWRSIQPVRHPRMA